MPVAADFARELAAQQASSAVALVSHLLFERLSEEDVAEVQRRLPEAPELQAHYELAPTQTLRETLTLIAGAWLGVPAVLDKTGLTPTQPPDDVHAMARGPLAAGGGFYEADLIAEALGAPGVELDDVAQRARLRLLLRTGAARAQRCISRDRVERMRPERAPRSRG